MSSKKGSDKPAVAKSKVKAAKPSKKAARQAQSSLLDSSSAADLLDLLPREFPSYEDSTPREKDTGLVVVFRYALLACICVLAFVIRLFAVARWESIIHEFDPWFNYRSTRYLISEGFYEFLDWMDDRSWYPLGRIVGGTVYPGIMITAQGMYWALNLINITINVRNVCVFVAPVFAALTAIATYLFVNEFYHRKSTALLGAAFVSIVPSYISRSVGGSYDNEGVAIFALVFVFYCWLKSVNTGSLFWGAATSLSYFYMVAAWGGYVFIVNIIPIYVIVLVVAGRYSPRLYVAYSSFYAMGSLLAMQVPYVGFNVITSAETAGAHGVFLMIQVYAIIVWLREHVAAKTLQKTFVVVAGIGVGAAAVALVALQLLGKITWTGRSLSLLDPTYAAKYVPIIASVSEHQPTTWTSFFFDLHILVVLSPVGLYFLFQDVTDAKIFVILYGTISWYFAGIMVRLMLTLAPIACVLAAVGLSEILHKFFSDMKFSMKKSSNKSSSTLDSLKSSSDGGNESSSSRVPFGISTSMIMLMTSLLVFYSVHTTYVASEAYSSPSIVLASKRADGTRVIFDDFREAYYWLRMNTPEDAKIMSWWDYGYQMAGMANRTTLVDNNTNNNTHIATVGRAMASPESKAYPIMRSLDVDYVLVVFGGVTGYQSDDINKFLWMVRIGGGVYPDEIQEANYFNEGRYRVDNKASHIMRESLMYKLCYYRFGEMTTDYGRPTGFDRVRQVEVGEKNIVLEHLDEAFTSEHWIVRIYKVRKPANRVGGYISNRDESFGEAKKKHTSSSSSSSSSSSKTEKKRDRVRFAGCAYSETHLGKDRVYGGGAAGANLNVAVKEAQARGKKFVAISKATESDGHAFFFSDIPDVQSFLKNDDPGCDQVCSDDDSVSCGCADDACLGLGVSDKMGDDSLRRWAVYMIGELQKK